jgi:hypothetical protein
MAAQRAAAAAALHVSTRWVPDADFPDSQTYRPPSGASLLSAFLMLRLLCWRLRCFRLEPFRDLPSSPAT